MAVLIRLVLTAVVVVCCQRGSVDTLPDDWAIVPPPAIGSEAERCANYAREEWAVALSPDGARPVITPAPPTDGDTLRIAGTVLVGDDLGEFGGAIWEQKPDGMRDTIKISGRDPATFHADNLRRFIRRGEQAYALVGLAHLGRRAGELIVLSRGASGWRGRSALELGGAPVAVTQVSEDSLLVVTSDALIAVSLDPMNPSKHTLVRNPVWFATYANSIARTRTGVVYIGMRSAVARLTPTNGGLHEEWLVPSTCRLRVLDTDETSCSCKGT